MLWISSFYFFFGLETNLATKNVDKNFQILYKPLPWLGENHIKVAAKGQTETHKHLPHLPRCGFWILQLSENPMGFWRKIEIPPSWNKHVHSWRMIEVASEQIWIAKSWARRNFQILIFFVSQSCKVKGKQIWFFPNITLFWVHKATLEKPHLFWSLKIPKQPGDQHQNQQPPTRNSPTTSLPRSWSSTSLYGGLVFLQNKHLRRTRAVRGIWDSWDKQKRHVEICGRQKRTTIEGTHSRQFGRCL